MKQVIKATTQNASGLLSDGKPMNFGSDGTFLVEDHGRAKDIDDYYGRKGTGDVVVVDYDNSERGHTYFFGGLRSPRARASYERIFGHS